MEQGGSPTSQQSSRSRPNYRHPILLEDGGSKDVEGSPNSPNSPNVGGYGSYYDPEAPFPHTDGPHTHPSNNPSLSNPPIGMGGMGSGPSSPTGTYHPHQFGSDHKPMHPSMNASPLHHPPTSSGNSPPQIPEPEYYHGVLPFGPPAASQAVSNMSQGPNGGYICNLCSLVFTRAHDARRHYMSKHSDVKSQCVCGKKFSRRDALLRHQRPDPVSGYGGCDDARSSGPTDS